MYPFFERRPPINSSELAAQFSKYALDKKCEDLKILDVQKIISYTSVVILCTGNSPRHVSAIADYIIEQSKKEHGVRPIGLEGVEKSQWVLIDFMDIVVHIFHKSVRQFYDLDHLWLDAKSLPVPKI